MTPTVSEMANIRACREERKASRKDNARFIAKVAGKAVQKAAGAIRDSLDDLWAIIIRRRAYRDQHGICALCGKRRELVAYHIIQRRHESTRWSLENGIGSCEWCNSAETTHRDEFARRAGLVVGSSKFDDLKAKSEKAADFSRADLLELEKDFKRRIKTGDY